ncbi:MAG: hypothetical protein CVT72_03700 [Alphaproteobacteria bacterium HGW-Alphaproteobacteria-11]|nr:MAG: hypothetical protein CVT72_03700 [Alphaproteobacteria bacterium HGW-Alphaproteobacteria-11]
MKVDPCAKWTPEIDALIAESAPADYPAGDLRAAFEAGEVSFLTVAEEHRIRAVVAYSLSPVAGRMELRVVGLNARRAPFLIRTAFATLENMLDSGARIIADIETDAMARIVEHLGMRLRALTYVKDVA